MPGPRYLANFTKLIISLSTYDSWEERYSEWKISGEHDCGPRKEDRVKCVCGHHGCRYVFELTNKINGESLYPVGTQCIKTLEDELGEIAERLMRKMQAESKMRAKTRREERHFYAVTSRMGNRVARGGIIRIDRGDFTADSLGALVNSHVLDKSDAVILGDIRGQIESDGPESVEPWRLHQFLHLAGKADEGLRRFDFAENDKEEAMRFSTAESRCE